MYRLLVVLCLVIVLNFFGDSLFSQVVLLEKVFVSEPFGSELKPAELRMISGTWKPFRNEREKPEKLMDMFGDNLQPTEKFWEDLYLVKVVEGSSLVVALPGWSEEEQSFQIENVIVYARKFNGHTLLFFELDPRHFVFATCSDKKGVAKIRFASQEFFQDVVSKKKVDGSLLPMHGFPKESKVHVLVEPTDQVLDFIKENFEECFSKHQVKVRKQETETSKIREEQTGDTKTSSPTR